MTDAPQTPVPLTPEEETEALAAEFALGLLDEDEARAAQARMTDDPVFGHLVRDWQERLAGIADELTPVMASARARLGIQRALGHSAEPLSNVPPIRRGQGGARGTGGPGGWLGWILGAVVAGAVALAVIIMPGGDAADYAADLVSEQTGLHVEARLDGREMEIALTEGAATEGRDLELWWIAGPDATPISLGVLPREGSARMTLPEGLEPGELVQLALSDEPLGGSPTGQATGPIVAIAPLTQS